jgi:hypothetical protein
MNKSFFSRGKVLQADNETLYNVLRPLILSFAILGYTDVAARLISKINNYDKLHGQYRSFRPLWRLWEYLGMWPDGEKARVLEEIRDERRSDDGEPPAKSAKTEEKKEEKITDEAVKAHVEKNVRLDMESSWLEEKSDETGPHTRSQYKRVIVSEVKKHIQNIGFHDAQTGSGAMDASRCLVTALDLAIQQDADTEDKTSVDGILHLISDRMSTNQQITYLTQCQRALPLFISGALVRILNIDIAKLDKFATDVEEEFTQRFNDGFQPADELSMKEALDMINHNTFHNPDADLKNYNPNEDTDTLYRAPATSSQIEHKSKELGVELPADYKEFLQLTNGFGVPFNGIIHEPPLNPIEEVKWTTDDEDYFTELDFALISSVFFQLLHIVPNYTLKVGKTLVLGTRDIDNTWLIPPSTMSKYQNLIRQILHDEIELKEGVNTEEVKAKIRNELKNFAGSEEKFFGLDWGCLTWASGSAVDMQGYAGFAAYLRSLAESGEKNEGDLLWGGYDQAWWGYALKKVGREEREGGYGGENEE